MSEPLDIDKAIQLSYDLSDLLGAIAEDQGVFELEREAMGKAEVKRSRGNLGARLHRAADDADLLAAVLRQAYWGLRDALPEV